MIKSVILFYIFKYSKKEKNFPFFIETETWESEIFNQRTWNHFWIQIHSYLLFI